jgi:murein peptide amidase A
VSGIDWQVFEQEFAREAMARGFRSTVIARTAAGEIRAWEKGEGKPLVYLSAGMHGDEPAGPWAMLELLRGGAFDERFCWAIVPMLNPEGLRAGTRGNAAGVDMNRDYLLKKTGEVRGHIAWLEALPVPDVFVSLHEDWEVAGFYLYEIRLGEDRPESTRELLAAAREVFPLEVGPLIDGHEIRDAGWIFHAVDPDEPEGWPEAIFMSHRGCGLSYTLETPSQARLDDRVQCQVQVVKRLIANGLSDL